MGRPLLLGGDVAASLRSRGVDVSGAGSLGRMVREDAARVDAHYEVEVAAGVDIVATLTTDTTPRALEHVGMAYRSAAITARAIDGALDAAARAGRPVAVAGVLGGNAVSPSGLGDLVEEHGIHAARLAAAGVDVVLARGFSSRAELLAAVVAAASTGVPTWAVVDVGDGTSSTEAPADLVRLLGAEGAGAVLFQTASPDVARAVVGAAREGGATLPLGVLLDAGQTCVEGYPDGGLDPEAWAREASSLLSLDLRALGGGRGCTHAHTEALGRVLRRQLPSIPPPGP